jgi:type IV pilus assembly protein PilW
MRNNPYQTGMTLIEIMIALLIGAFLLGGVLQIFIGSKQTYRMQQNLSRLQENGRFAMSFLAKDIRMAGYWGCLSPSNPNTDIDGTNNNPAGTVDSIDDGTDTITLKGAYVLTPTGTCGTPVVTSAAYYTDTSSTITYKINNRVLQQAHGPLNNLTQVIDLVEGIENMQILYGVDTSSDGAPNYYVPANNVTNPNWPKVVSIRISLLAATLDDNLTTQPQPYTYNGTTTTPTDRKIRRVFTSTIALRNRLP